MPDKARPSAGKRYEDGTTVKMASRQARVVEIEADPAAQFPIPGATKVIATIALGSSWAAEVVD